MSFSGTPGGGIYLNNYAGIVAVAESGKLWGAVNHQQGFSPMPKNADKLSDCKINQIKFGLKMEHLITKLIKASIRLL